MLETVIKNEQVVTSKQAATPCIVYVSTFPPRKCGIATFTEDITNAMDEMFSPMAQSKIVAMNPSHVHSYHYPRKVIHQITQDDKREYNEIARQINQDDTIHIVNIQHEFGIFGGEWGSYLIQFAKTLEKPLIITLHTVLPNPKRKVFNVINSLADNAKALIVMTFLSKEILVNDYGLSPRKIHVIPHGIHSRPFTSSKKAKMSLGYSGRVVLSTFGLLGRNKGLEYVIDALPEVLERHANFVYIIFGATHPVVLAKEGESYRNFLIDKIHELQLYDHVKLYNKYLTLNELLHFLKATDIYISPSLNLNQACSGTLSYALGMGRPVISTSFSQATEVVTDDVGILVDFKSPKSYADAIIRFLEDENLSLRLGINAYFRTRYMTWPNVALKYAILFSRYAQGLKEIHKKRSLPDIKLDHLIRLTDNFGILHHAKLSKLVPSSGYTLDDNASALLAIARYYKVLGKLIKRPAEAADRSKLLKLGSIYQDFISFASIPNGYFYNFINPDTTPDYDKNHQVNLEESFARAIYALAVTSTVGSIPRRIRQKALSLLEEKMNRYTPFDSPRAVAYQIKTLHLLKNKSINMGKINKKNELTKQCDKLVQLYETNHSTDWLWFEECLTYMNSILSEALLIGYLSTQKKRYLHVGKITLDFLLDKSFDNDLLIPIGPNGWYKEDERRPTIEQHPEDVSSIVYALKTCYAITNDEHYSELMYKAFYWFLGVNTLNQVVYDRITGGCYDGVGKKTINLNQGAGSTIAYLTARLAFE